MSITIRPCGPADAAALALVGQATFLETYAGTLPVADILAHCATEHGEAYYARALAKPDHRLWIAEMEEGRAPMGYAVLCPPDLPTPAQAGDVELKRIYLLHRFHGSGLGGRLMAAVAESARTAGFRRMLLGVYRENERAMTFYARQGFVEVGVRKFKVGARVYDDPVLARTL